MTATQILRDRARALARVPEQVSDSLIEVLEFRLGIERYAVETPLVGEVYPLRDLTPLPCTPRLSFSRSVAWRTAC